MNRHTKYMLGTLAFAAVALGAGYLYHAGAARVTARAEGSALLDEMKRVFTPPRFFCREKEGGCERLYAATPNAQGQLTIVRIEETPDRDEAFECPVKRTRSGLLAPADHGTFRHFIVTGDGVSREDLGTDGSFSRIVVRDGLRIGAKMGPDDEYDAAGRFDDACRDAIQKAQKAQREQKALTP